MSDKAAFIESHASYPDVFPNGLEAYPFAQARIAPCVYEVPDGAKVLDIGCNSGEFIKLLKEKKGCDVYGVDISQGMVDLCKTKGLENVQVADADHLPFEDDSFDVVTLMEVLMFFSEPVAYLKEIRRVLKPGGVLIGSVPHKNIERLLWDDKRKHQRYYTEDGLRADLGQVFDRTHLRILKGGQFSLGLASSLLAKEPAEMLFKSGGFTAEPWESEMTKSKALRVWFGFTQLAGDVYYRMRGFIDKMRAQGYNELAYEDFNYDGSESQTEWQKRVKSTLVLNTLEALVRTADFSIWQLVGNRHCLAFLRCAKDLVKKPMLTELDDWIWDLPAYNIAANPYQPNSEPEWVCSEQLVLSDGFIVSTTFIQERLKEMFPEKPVYVIPNALDFNIWDNLKPVDFPQLKKEPGRIRIGYTGCGNHDGDVEIVKRPLLKILEEFPNVDFVTSHPFPTWSDVKEPRFMSLNRWVSIDQYPHEVAGWGLDIGIAPLRDNHFNRAKSNLRWLEFSALHIPTVASRVRPFAECVQDGVDGFLCRSESEWYEALKVLILDENKRRSSGEAAYVRVKKDFNMDAIAMQYAKALEDIKLWTVPRSTSNAAAS